MIVPYKAEMFQQQKSDCCKLTLGGIFVLLQHVVNGRGLLESTNQTLGREFGKVAPPVQLRAAGSQLRIATAYVCVWSNGNGFFYESWLVGQLIQ